jgi:hypothetical protein
MPHITTLARLGELRRALTAAVRVTKELAMNQTMVRLAASDPERWNFLLDSLAAGMEPGEQGSVLQVLTALDGALGD